MVSVDGSLWPVRTAYEKLLNPPPKPRSLFSIAKFDLFKGSKAGWRRIPKGVSSSPSPLPIRLKVSASLRLLPLIAKKPLCSRRRL